MLSHEMKLIHQWETGVPGISKVEFQQLNFKNEELVIDRDIIQGNGLSDAPWAKM